MLAKLRQWPRWAQAAALIGATWALLLAITLLVFPSQGTGDVAVKAGVTLMAAATFWKAFSEVVNRLFGEREGAPSREEGTVTGVRGDVHGEQVTIITTREGPVTLQVPEQRPLGPTPRGVPPLPAYYVERTTALRQLKDAVLAPAGPGVLALCAVHGLPGVGKSVLAQALAHDPEIQAAFPAAILWATLGEKGNPDDALVNWGVGLGLPMGQYANTEGRRLALQTALQAKKALLVADDVWHADQVAPLRVGGEGCRMVITTRQGAVIQAVGARAVWVDVLTEEEAVELVARRLDQVSLPAADRERAAELVKLVACLPLAVQLAAAQVAMRGWAPVLADLQGGQRRLEALALD